MSYVVTGGAGFIGSCMIRTLNDHGIEDIIIVDNIASTEKWKNLVNKKYLSYINKSELQGNLDEVFKVDEYGSVETIIHLGACSSTTEKNFDYLYANNLKCSKLLWNYCVDKGIPFLYASSAATYGDGNHGFDDRMHVDALHPLNGYGYSKQLFDVWISQKFKKGNPATPSLWVGFKFFNVYGPNEYFKGSMASMIYHCYKQINENGCIKLFKSYHPDFVDGGQLRDFVYVKDVCDVMWYFLEEKPKSGIFNIGTGKARSFRELAEATFSALNIEPNIEYIDMPDVLKGTYQYYTQANIAKLREAGYTGEFRDLENGARDYVENHLDKGFEVY